MIYHFKPFAKLYHKVKYGLNPYSKYTNKAILLKKIKLFIKENPRYGRKFVYTKHNSLSHFKFNGGIHHTFDICVKTHFNDMTPEKIKHISTFNRLRRQAQPQVVDDLDSNTDSDDEDVGIDVGIEVD